MFPTDSRAMSLQKCCNLSNGHALGAPILNLLSFGFIYMFAFFEGEIQSTWELFIIVKCCLSLYFIGIMSPTTSKNISFLFHRGIHAGKGFFFAPSVTFLGGLSVSHLIL